MKVWYQARFNTQLMFEWDTETKAGRWVKKDTGEFYDGSGFTTAYFDSRAIVQPPAWTYPPELQLPRGL